MENLRDFIYKTNTDNKSNLVISAVCLADKHFHSKIFELLIFVLKSTDVKPKTSSEK
jgi:hypothetical protein